MKPEQSAEKIPVVYILSTGRSGSTLLDLLLGSSENTWTLGEAQMLPWELRENRRPCGCGTPVAECDFWREVLPSISVGEGSYPIDNFREAHTSAKAFRWSILWSMLLNRKDKNLHAAIQEYGNINARYFSKVRSEATERLNREVRWLVDASKDIYRLLWLDASGQFDLRVVFLTKSPQAYAYSRIKSADTARLKMASHATISWTLVNSLAWLVCYQKFRSRFIHVRYHDLASRPDAYRSCFEEWLDTPFPAWTPTVIREYVNHGISGGRMRWKDSAIRLDEAWMHKLSSTEKSITRALSFPVAQALGY
jgi:hypothetical protein